MSTRPDGGTRGLALVTEEDDWFATPQQEGVELEVLPWDDELEWQLRDPSSRDLGRRQAALVLAVVVAILLVLAGILIGRATKSSTTKVVTTAAPTSQTQTNAAATSADNNSAATDTPTPNTSSQNTTTTETPSTSTTTPAASTPASNSVPTGTVLQSGSKGAAVTALQNALTTLGYVPGVADGTYGATTAQAVKAFQTSNGLTADGIAAAGTIASINTALANSASTSTSTPDANSVPTDAKLQLGSKGASVIALQKALTTLGYPAGAADGTYGATTTQAVKAFQTAKNLTADGIAGASTLAAINAALASG